MAGDKTKIVNIPLNKTKKRTGFLDVYEGVILQNNQDVKAITIEYSAMIDEAIDIFNEHEVQTIRDAESSLVDQLKSMGTYNDKTNQIFDMLTKSIASIAAFYRVGSHDQLAEHALNVALDAFVEEGVLNDAKTREKIETVDYYKERYDNVIFRLYDTSSGRRKEVKDVQYQITKTTKDDKFDTFDPRHKRFKTLFEMSMQRFQKVVAKGEKAQEGLKTFVVEITTFLDLLTAYGKARGLESREEALSILGQNPFYLEHLADKISLPEIKKGENVYEFKQFSARMLIATLVTFAADGGITGVGSEYFDFQNSILDLYSDYYSQAVSVMEGTKEQELRRTGKINKAKL